MFERESEGIYVFGSKKTSIKFENNDLKVRVGGGYLSIEEFVAQYLPLELEKLNKKGLLDKYGRPSSPALYSRGGTTPERNNRSRSPGGFGSYIQPANYQPENIRRSNSISKINKFI
jgi:hypothetical protein